MLIMEKMDFFNDMVINVQIPAQSASAGTVPAFPAHIAQTGHGETAAAKVSASTPQGLNFPATTTLTKYTMEYVNAAGAVLNATVGQQAGAAASNFVRYAEYPGQRLFKKVKFEVNGNPLDEYTAEAALFHQKFKVAPNKLTGWKRLVGQEVPIEAYSDLSTVSGASSYNLVSSTPNVNGATPLGWPVNSADTSRKLVQVVNGPQTAKATQPALDLWIPLN